ARRGVLDAEAHAVGHREGARLLEEGEGGAEAGDIHAGAREDAARLKEVAVGELGGRAGKAGAAVRGQVGVAGEAGRMVDGRRRAVAIRPGLHVLLRGQAAGAAGEADERRVAADRLRDVYGVRRGEGGAGHRVGQRLGQGGAVVAEGGLHQVRVLEVDA